MKLSSWLAAAICLAVVEGKRPNNLLNVRVDAVATVVATAVATAAPTAAFTAAPIAPVCDATALSNTICG